MMPYCENCGTKTNNGICSNCQEELYILEFQSEYVDSVSSEFLEKAQKQRKEIKQRRNYVNRDIEG